MTRTFICLALLLVTAGCWQSSPPVAVPPTPAAKQPLLPKPVQPEKKPVPPAPTYETPEQQAVAALKDVSTADLVQKLADDDQRAAATRALAQRGDAAVPQLLEALENSDPKVRAAAVFALGEIKATAAVAPLTTLAEKDDSEVVRDAARFALDAIGGK